MLVQLIKIKRSIGGKAARKVRRNTNYSNEGRNGPHLLNGMIFVQKLLYVPQRFIVLNAKFLISNEDCIVIVNSNYLRSIVRPDALLENRCSYRSVKCKLQNKCTYFIFNWVSTWHKSHRFITIAYILFFN